MSILFLELLHSLNHAHSKLTYCAPTLLQYGCAKALEVEKGDFEGIPKIYEKNVHRLSEAFRIKGLTPYVRNFCK